MGQRPIGRGHKEPFHEIAPTKLLTVASHFTKQNPLFQVAGPFKQSK